MDREDIERIRNPGFNVARRGYDPHEVDRYLRELSEWLETDAADELGSYAVKHKLELAGRTTTQILLTTEQECEDMRERAETQAADAVDTAERTAREVRRLADEETTAQREQAERESQSLMVDARVEAKRTLDEAEAKRLEIEAAAREARGAADAYSAETRTAADGYSAQTRQEADAYAAETQSAADAYAAETRQTADDDATKTAREASAKARRTIKDGEERRNAIETLIADLRARRDAALAELESLADEVAKTASARRSPASGDPFAKPEVLDPLERGAGTAASTPSRTGS